MKPIALLLLVALVAVTLAAAIPARYVEDHETISQVLWNKREALLFAGVRRNSWSGSYAGLGLQIVKALFGKIPDYQTSKEWVLVARITADGMNKHVENETGFFHPQPFEDGLFRGDKPLLKLAGNSFAPATQDETEKFRTRTRASTPNYDNIEGWSSRMNLLDQPELRVEIALKLEGGDVMLVAERTADRSRKWIVAKFANGNSTEVFSVVEKPRFVNAKEYDALISRN